MREACKYGLVYGAAFTTKVGNKRSLMSVARDDRELTDGELELLNGKFLNFVDILMNKALPTDGELEVLRPHARRAPSSRRSRNSSASRDRRSSNASSKACAKLNARNSAQAIALCVARNYFGT